MFDCSNMAVDSTRFVAYPVFDLLVALLHTLSLVLFKKSAIERPERVRTKDCDKLVY